MERNNASNGASRRRFLSKVGAATVVGVPTAAAQSGTAKSLSYQEKLDKSHKILQATNSVEKQHKFLRNRGVGITSESTEMGLNSGDGVSVQEVSSEDLSLTFSLYTECDGREVTGFTAELTWEYNNQYYEASGYPPNDYVGIAWDDGSWYYANNNVNEDLYSNSPYVNYYSGSSGGGPVWEVDDVETIYEGWENDKLFYTGVDMSWEGSEPDDRTIAASYSHTWSDVTVKNVSVGFPAGVSVAVGSEDKRYTKDTSDSGDFLRLRKRDAILCSVY